MRRLAVLLGLLSAAAVIAGQAPDPGAGVITTSLAVAIAAPAGPIAPLGPFMALPVQVTYAYLEAAPAREGAAIALTAVPSVPSLVATVTPSTVYVPAALPPCGCAREVVLDAVLLLSATQDAPAFQPATVAVTARAAANGAYQAAEATGEVEVMAGYFPMVEVTTPSTRFSIGPGQRVDALATVTNFGNGPSRMEFSIAGVPRGFQVQLPPPVVLGPRQADSPRNSAEVTIGFTAESGAEPGHATMRVEASSTEDPGAARNVSEVPFSISVRQLLGTRDPDAAGRGVPAPALAEAAVVVAAQLWARRRHGDVV